MLGYLVGWVLQTWLGATADSYARFLTLGFAAHILVDTLNKTGVDLFWPARVRGVFFGNERYRIVSAGRGDYWFMTVCLVANLALYPLARDGFTFSLHQAFGDIYSVSTDFKEYGDRNRIWADLEAVEAISNRKVSGHFEILAAPDNGSVLVERDGVKQIVSRSAPLHLFPVKAKILIGEPCRISTVETEMAGRTLGELPRFAGAGRVLYHGYLTPAKMSPVSVHQDRYDPIAVRLDKLRLEHAEYRDIEEQGIEDLVIREGTVIAKIYDLPAGLYEEPTSQEAQRKTRVIELRLRPDDQLLISEGDKVRIGQVIARRNSSKQLRVLDLQVTADRERLKADQEEIELQLSAIDDEFRAAHDRQTEAEAQVIRIRGDALLVKENQKLAAALADGKTRLDELCARRQLMASRREKAVSRVRAITQEASERRAIIEAESEIKVGFEGRIVRIMREAAGSEMTLRIRYQSR